MTNIGAPELVLIAVVALLVFGPRRLPEIARSAGKAIREFKRATSELTDELTAGLDDPPSGGSPRPGPRV